MKKQTAGRDNLGAFAPKFAEINDDIIFGQIWSREKALSARDRSMITVAALVSGGNFEQLTYHLDFAKANGVTKAEIAEILTHLAFYVGWPKAWSAFNLAKAIFLDDKLPAVHNSAIFPKGERITNGLFIGDAFLYVLVSPEPPHDIAVANITFSPAARNNWHSHDIGQFLLVTDGVGYYQEYGQAARLLHAGDVVNIPAQTKHWHGAALNSWFAHIAVTPGQTQWFEPLPDDAYEQATEATP